ncbi:YeeE/YedE thiosulfate transporter family protein [Symbiobacterium thermophilum]|uniref:YeeE/YedE thiosulfate transporter family protein n=1 Tax=Symbiobacterium thermophilum TaxID=2734 RepID=UPI0035C6F60F
MELLLGLLIGTAFGFILRRSRVASHACIRGALALTDFHMLKLLLTAVGVTLILVFPLSTLGIVNFSVKTTYVVGIVVGGLLFGIGMAVAGGLAGSFAYALLYEPLQPLLIAPLNFGKLTLPELLGLNPVVTGVGVGLLLLAGVVLLDRLTRPKQAEIPDLAKLGHD